MINIIKRPYAGLWSNYNPVYNGLNFIVDSNRKLTSGFRYVCEIYAGSSNAAYSKVGELRHNPDISNNNQGIFDVGRVLEDFITYNLAWNALGINNNSNHYKHYYVEFGEEYARSARIGALVNSGGKFYIGVANGYHDLQSSYSSVLIQGTSLASLNAPHQVLTSVSAGAFTINLPYQGGVSYDNAYFIQGAYSSNGLQTYTGVDGGTYYSFSTAGALPDVAYAEPGEGIQVYPVDTSKSFVTGTWQILDKYFDGSKYIYKTNIPYVSSMNLNPVHIFPTGSIHRKSLINTKNDKAIAWNSVFQYEDILNYDVKPYAAYPKDTTKKFLTYRPRTKMRLCLSDYSSISFLGQTNMPSTTNTSNCMGVVAEVWTKSKPFPISTTSASNVIGSGASLGSKYSKYTLIPVSGNVASNFTAGSYVTVAYWTQNPFTSTWTSGTYTGRIIKSIYAGSTFILIDMPYGTSFKNDTSHQWTITVTQRVLLRAYDFSIDGDLRTPAVTAARWEFGIGPKNMALNNCQEFSDDDVLKYFISLYAYDITLVSNNLNSCYQKYAKSSETWEIEIADCPCEGYKPYTIFWMNKLGGWDYYNFTARTDKTRKIEARNQFRRTLYNYGTFLNGQKGQSTYSTLANDEWTLNTDWLTQAEIDWLQEIYESPEVYIILKSHTNEFLATPNDIILPVNITNEEVILHSKKNRGEKGGLFQYQITAAAANRREVQRGSNFGGNYFYNRA